MSVFSLKSTYRKPSMKSKKNLDVEKKIYICPNSATQNRNVRIDDNGTEIILNHVLNPWIIGQFFLSVTK